MPRHPVATRSEIETILRCGEPRKVPLFLPAIYEHKAWFIGSTPSAISRDANLLAKAVLAEHEAIGPDALVVGVDVYNLEAEAVGCKVTFYEGDDTSIPGISPGNHLLHVGDDLTHAPIPNPLKDGRMPVNLEAVRQVRRALGKDCFRPVLSRHLTGGRRGDLPLLLRQSRLGAERARLRGAHHQGFCPGLYRRRGGTDRV
jgi:uroporphyrinogen decarboxylase